jgi:hypothetical protein
MKQLSEAHIQRTCTEFLELDGWRPLRTDPVSDRSHGKGFGEPGMADHLYIRYLDPADFEEHEKKRWAEVLWVEYKRQRGGNGKRALFTKAEKAKIHQTAWHAQERARGALTIILGEDCVASIEGFMDWYAKSGLLRKSSLVRKIG